jgi:hypothetical protein
MGAESGYSKLILRQSIKTFISRNILSESSNFSHILEIIERLTPVYFKAV